MLWKNQRNISELPLTVNNKKVVKNKMRNYSQQGWEGNKYRDTKELPLKEIAAKIKQEVQAKYPEIKVSVRTDHYSGGRSIDVHIISAPFKLLVRKVIYPEMANLPEDKIPKYAWGWAYTPKAQEVLDGIKKICNQYNYDDSDGMIDYFDTSFYNSVDYDWELMHEEEKKLGLM